MTCPICQTRPKGKDKRVATCGDKTCAYEYRERRYKARYPDWKPGHKTAAREPIRRGRTHAAPAESVTAAPGTASSSPGGPSETEPALPPSGPLGAPFPEADASRWTLPAPLAPASVHTGRYRRVVFWPDTHLPFQDDRAVALASRVVEHVQPDLLVLLGDIIDCGGFSRFAHNTIDSRMHFQTELDAWEALATLLRDRTPGAERFYIRGNHEARIEKWLFGQPQLQNLRSLNLGTALMLEKLGFHGAALEELSLASGALTATHGTKLGGAFAGLAARQEMATYGTSGVSGHTHRLCKYLQRDKAGLRVWIEAGSLCTNPPHYLPKTQNWQQGVVVGEVSDTGNDFDLEVVPFRLSYRCRIGAAELSA